MQFVIPLSRDQAPLFQQVYAGLRDAILTGKVPAGSRLPSTREMATQLGISRTVAVTAFEQLLAEGFVTGRTGSGTYVSNAISPDVRPKRSHPARIALSKYGVAAAQARAAVHLPSRAERPLPLDFAVGCSDLETFPFALWRRLLLRSARRTRVAELDYGPPEGNSQLRELICTHVRRARAVQCDTDQVIIVNGSQQAIDLISRVLLERGDPVCIEDPSYQGTREALRVAGAKLLPIAVDAAGIIPSKLPSRARLAFVTPSHQFPTGAILPLARRIELLRWAKRANAFIVEDDYDGEFNYAGNPLESLQGLDREGRVIYIGTFSRTIFSALRLGYLIVPKSLIAAFSAAKWLCDRHSPTLEQQTLAEFLAGGHYERYLRRVRQRNSKRREVLLESIAKHLGSRVTVTGQNAGAHIVLWLNRNRNEDKLVQAAAEVGVRVYGIAPYYIHPPRAAGLMLGYSRLRESEIEDGIRRLARVL
ncbi:transcriptional regulator, GntR family [Candidatus Koribacter versatilis Ellin345]|uniref:Transcriptional regulator, GntR family n=1 Tax=Koribacter versatilis (strain Ellin345) TaxID=204669 RepID=Q1IPM7_KORVE|nr:PLP-dependent aminotransferase family protein [Candidatus Koribacter versatilis]ABF41173.1 transcriptional regulator, GntR family [Candidatus Koribacter versatilis Ellin345]